MASMFFSPHSPFPWRAGSSVDPRPSVQRRLGATAYPARQPRQGAVRYRQEMLLQGTRGIAARRIGLDAKFLRPADALVRADVRFRARRVAGAQSHIDFAVRVAFRAFAVIGFPAVDGVDVLLV